MNDTEPYEIIITDKFNAVIKGNNYKLFPQVIEEFRIYAEHIVNFYDAKNNLVKSYPKKSLLKISIDDIEPSQFYIDINKMNALKNFIKSEEDVIIPVLKHGDKYICLDGYTRLMIAHLSDIKNIYTFKTSSEGFIYDFIKEAQSRDIFHIRDLQILSHDDYIKKWYSYCDEYFG
ncbi:hypothetical protein [Peptoniphilus olsenii]|uniref:hypothetical protein n=1 Tax=Peptoniphilus olsenii TaxID=411570 RepID=UPI003393000A